MNYSITFWVIAALAVLFIGLGKSGFGGGVGALATPVLALIMPVATAAGLLLPLYILTDLVTIRQFGRTYDRVNLRLMLPGALLGVALGGYFFDALRHNEQALKAVMGALAILFVIYQAGRTLIFGVLGKYRPTAAAGVIMGGVAGFTSTIAHAGGPPATIYLLPQELPRDEFVGTNAILFVFINLGKLIPYIWLGLFPWGDWLTVLLLAPMAILGVLLGVALNRWFSDRWFTRVVYTLLFVAGVQLLMGSGWLAQLALP